MKRWLVIVVVMSMMSHGIVLSAQEGIQAVIPAQASDGVALLKDAFDTKEECHAALNSGEYRFHKPTSLAGHDNLPLIDGKKYFPLVYAQPTCAYTDVGKGKMMYVPKEPQTLYRAELKNGVLVPYATDDCGNKTPSVTFPPLKIPTSSQGDPGKPGAPGALGPQGEPGKEGPRGADGKPGTPAVSNPHSHKILWIIAGVGGGLIVGGAVMIASSHNTNRNLVIIR